MTKDLINGGSPTNFALCDVLSIDDACEGNRIKVRILGVDNEKTVAELPYCFPLLPKHLSVNPKVGEKVFVFFQSPETSQSFRTFIGPIIPQEYGLNFYPGHIDNPSSIASTTIRTSNFSSSKTTMTENSLSFDVGSLEEDKQKKYINGQTKILNGWNPAPSRNGENDGSIPARDSIVIKGRCNTDIVLGENETQIRCGFLKNPSDKNYKTKLNYNKSDVGYIQLKYKPMTDPKVKDVNAQKFNSNINIVADRINLLSYDSSSYIEKLGEKDMVTDEVMEQIFQKAHALPYGDDLVAFLKDFVRVFLKHTHPFHQEPPCLNQTDESAVSIDLDKILSKSIRIN